MRAVPAPARPLVAARRLAAVLAALALVAACGNDDTATVEPAPGSSAPLGTLPPVTSAGGATSTTSDGVDAPSTTAAAGEPATTTAAPPESGAPPPVTLDGDVPVGQFASAFLRPDLSERLVVEIHADAEPRSGSVDHFVDTLAEVSGKPVSVVVAGAPGGGDREWTGDELRAAADAGATSEQGGGVAIVRLLFVRGTFEGDDGVLGVSVRGDVAAVFLDRVEAAGGLLGGGAAIERAVTTHELGHLLGLVDLALDTGRADPDHPGHSRNQGSVMYWAVESDLVGQVLGADPPSEFDADDLRDLGAIRDG